MSVEDSVRTILETIPQTENADVARKWQLDLSDFVKLHKRFQGIVDSSGYIDWDRINPPDAKILKQLTDFDKPKNLEELFSKLVVIKLNGGLGTTMGCVGPKSVIDAHCGKTFLDLTVEQIIHFNKTFKTSIPLVLMNSFSTHEDTNKVISKCKDSLRILTFMQSQYPRIKQSDLLPVTLSVVGENSAWYPPGHGDFYNSFANSGLLDTLIKEGRTIAFVSNVDNLGATINDKILSFMCNEKVDFAMEVTAKTHNDVKGGTIINYEGKPKLLEIAQVPPNHKADFESLKKFKIFNTNNLWLNLPSVQTALTNDSFSNFDIIVNKKVADGIPIIQLETAIGAAIQCFSSAIAIQVPRDRFLPVKSTNELLIVQSALFEETNGTLELSEHRLLPELPEVRLGECFKKVGEYLNRFATLPNILDLHQLVCVGNVRFGKNVTLKGSVIFVADRGKEMVVCDESVYENNVVVGYTDNLSVLPLV